MSTLIKEEIKVWFTFHSLFVSPTLRPCFMNPLLAKNPGNLSLPCLRTFQSRKDLQCVTATYNLAQVFHSIFQNNYTDAGLLRDRQGAILSQYPPLASEAAAARLDLSGREAAWLLSAAAPYLSNVLFCPFIQVELCMIRVAKARGYLISLVFIVFLFLTFSSFLLLSFPLFSFPHFSSFLSRSHYLSSPLLLSLHPFSPISFPLTPLPLPLSLLSASFSLSLYYPPPPSLQPSFPLFPPIRSTFLPFSLPFFIPPLLTYSFPAGSFQPKPKKVKEEQRQAT